MTVTQHDSDGVSICVEDIGAGDPALVLVHGFTGSRLDWVDVAPALATERRVVMLDNRGHGESENTGDPASYTFDALVGDLESLVDGLALDQFDLLGHSMGGVIAMRYALAHEDRLRSLLLMDTAAEPAIALPAEIVQGIATTGRTQGMGAAGELVAQLMEQVTGMTVDPARLNTIKQRIRLKWTQLDVAAFEAFAAELRTYPSLVDRLREIRLPVTVIVGENDTVLRPEATTLVEAIPGATEVVVAAAGHSPQEDNPETWLTAVEGHLSRLS